jgi:hypothetical protein
MPMWVHRTYLSFMLLLLSAGVGDRPSERNLVAPMSQPRLNKPTLASCGARVEESRLT